MKIGYIRIHDETEKVGEKKDLIKDYGIDRWFVDSSGTNDPTPKRDSLFTMIGRKGAMDELHVVRLFDLCRTKKELVTIPALLQRKGVKLFEDGQELDTSFFESLKQWEKDKRNHQTMKGRNRPGAGAPKGPRDAEKALRAYLLMQEKDEQGQPKYSIREVCRMVGCAVNTLYNSYIPYTKKQLKSNK